MPTLPNMVLVTPTLGGDSGTWDDKINAMFALVDAHDHTSGKGVQVPVAGLNINADFAMGGNAVTGLGSIAFNAVTALAAGSKRLFVSSADNELYWRTNAGTNVKLTNGASINTTLVGGIVGDYSTVGAEVAFSDADQVYTFKDQSSPTKKWARLASGPVRIYENDTTESVYVEHAVAAALAAPYTVTWPAALPGADALVQITSAGAISFSNTTTQSITAAGFKFTTAETLVLPPCLMQARSGGTQDADASSWTLPASTAFSFHYPIVLPEGCRITGFLWYVSKSSDATNTITVRLRKTTVTGGFTTISTVTDAQNAPGAITTLAASGLTETVGSNAAYQLELTQSDATPSAPDTSFQAKITFDRPV